jgi:hypothetical protein
MHGLKRNEVAMAIFTEKTRQKYVDRKSKVSVAETLTPLTDDTKALVSQTFELRAASKEITDKYEETRDKLAMTLDTEGHFDNGNKLINVAEGAITLTQYPVLTANHVAVLDEFKKGNIKVEDLLRAIQKFDGKIIKQFAPTLVTEEMQQFIVLRPSKD